MHRRAARLVTLLALGLFALGCGDSSSPPSANQNAGVAADPTPADPGGDDQCVPAPLEQRAAQVLVVGLPGATVSSDAMVEEILDVGVGGVLITTPNVKSSAQIGQFVSDVRALAGRPIVMTAGEESGRVATFRDVLGPTPAARSLAASRSAQEVRDMAEDVGSRLAALGIDLDLAPVVDLDGGPAGGIIGDRSFSADPSTASAYGLAWAQGLAAAGVHPTAKHFPGHGRVTGDSHVELPTVDASLEELRGSDLVPFAELIDAGVPVVMLDHIAYTVFDPDLPASLSPKAYQFLREMGFEGVAMTDSVGMGAVNLMWSFPEAAVLSVSAGADAVLTTDGSQARSMRDALVEAVRSGELPESRLDEAAARMVALAGGDTMAATCRSVELPQLDGSPAN
ncbi:MAG TPA: glycoside hydrolase family 3 N-terminal domain-containing protein [Acidimicrobiales bacterium]|nr:glycoside hydrolase family 3 N-terminal domain-containing protein [Acidimicrobiales bacterium]